MAEVKELQSGVTVSGSFVIALWLYVDTYQNGAYHHGRVLLAILASSLLAAYGFTTWQKHNVKRAGLMIAMTVLFAIANVIILFIVNTIRPDVSIH